MSLIFGRRRGPPCLIRLSAYGEVSLISLLAIDALSNRRILLIKVRPESSADDPTGLVMAST